MQDPARTGAVVYAKDTALLARFYRQLLHSRELHAEPQYVVLQSPDFQLVIHAIPEHIAGTFAIASPPAPREDAAIKLFFTVPSIESARSEIAGLGGFLHGQVWQGRGFSACNAVDPEGNILQVREMQSTD